MIGTLKGVWKLNRDVEVIVLEENLFLFNFLTLKDKERILEGALWLFDKHLLMFQDFNGELPPDKHKFHTALFWFAYMTYH
ncbi:hypothetical protein PTKIN_Ptkin13bG0136800 [Pterospermum kingtungense]